MDIDVVLLEQIRELEITKISGAFRVVFMVALKVTGLQLLGAADPQQGIAKQVLPREFRWSATPGALLLIGHLLEHIMRQGVAIDREDPPFAVEQDQVLFGY